MTQLYLENKTHGLPPDAVEKLRAMLTFRQDRHDPEQLRIFPFCEAHHLTPACKGVWRLHVIRIGVLTFRVVEGEMVEVNYEDYH